nr:MAG: capsid protein [Cressdnaviricota sp.]
MPKVKKGSRSTKRYTKKNVSHYKKRSFSQKSRPRASGFKKKGNSGTKGVKVAGKTPQSIFTRKTLNYVHGSKPKPVMSEHKLSLLKRALAAPNFYNIEYPGAQTINTDGQTNWSCFDFALNTDMAAISGFVNSSTIAVRWTLNEWQGEVTISNNTNHTMFARVYEIEPRWDFPLQMVSPLNLATAQGWPDPSTAGGKIPEYAVSATIFQNPKFVAYMKVNSTRLIELPAGQTQVLRIAQNTPKSVLGERTQTNSLYGMQGFMKSLLVQQWGNQVEDLTGTFATNYASGALDFLWRVKYNYTFVSDSTQNSNYSDGLVTITSGNEIFTLPQTGVSGTAIANGRE